MKSHTFVVLLLSVAFTFTALAQQTGSNSGPTSAAQAAPAPQSVDTDSVREPLQPVKSTDFWDGDQPNVMNLIFHPFATKAYVRRQTQPIGDRLNELNEVTAADALKSKGIDARSQQGLQLGSEKTNLADQHASDAVNRAQVAETAATQASGRILSDEKVVGNLDQYKGETQTEIHFRTGQTVLSKQAKEALDRMAVPLKDQHNYIIEVRSFAPGGGHAAIAASKNMADSVVRYLVLNHRIPVYRIYTVGMGSAPVAAQGNATKRVSGGRVEVNLLKNDLVSSAQR